MNNLRLDVSSTAVFDLDGFLIDSAMWSESFADRIAQNDGLGKLSELQLSLLQTLRHEFFKHDTVPALHHVCHLIGQDPDCMQHLFPNPGEEAKTYL